MSQFDELPEGWVGTDLKDIGICKTSKITPSDFPEELFEVWSVPALETGRPEIIKGHEIGSSKQIVYENDVLLCKINPRLNRVWKVSKKDKLRQIASTEWVVFRVPSNCPDYLVYFFREQKFRSLLCADITGVGGSLTRARPQEIQRLNIVLPPLNEQRRIVEKIEVLTARSRKARAALNEIPALLDQFRQSVLAAAFRGDLTADWRAQNPNVEPAEALLEHIRVERRKRWEEAELETMKAKGKEPKNIKWKERYETPKEVDFSDLPQLPHGWHWVKWQEIGICQNGRSFPSQEYSTQGTKLLRPGNLHLSGEIEWTDSNTRFMPDDWAEKYPSHVVCENELVINLTAQSLADEFLGRVCLTGEEERCLLNQRIARLTPMVISNKFCLWLFKSPVFRQFVDTLNTRAISF